MCAWDEGDKEQVNNENNCKVISYRKWQQIQDMLISIVTNKSIHEKVVRNCCWIICPKTWGINIEGGLKKCVCCLDGKQDQAGYICLKLRNVFF